jgi:hypothetical protein
MRKISGNAARVRSGRGPKCHVVGAEVCTSVNFPSLPGGGGRERGNSIRNEAINSPILNNGRVLKSHDDYERVSFNGEIAKMKGACQRGSQTGC